MTVAMTVRLNLSMTTANDERHMFDQVPELVTQVLSFSAKLPNKLKALPILQNIIHRNLFLAKFTILKLWHHKTPTPKAARSQTWPSRALESQMMQQPNAPSHLFHVLVK